MCFGSSAERKRRFRWGNAFVWPWLHNAAAAREHCRALGALRLAKSHQQISVAVQGDQISSLVTRKQEQKEQLQALHKAATSN